jgi:ribosomal protein L11 methyltransferase
LTLVRFSVSADPELLDALADCLLSAGAGALEEGPSSLSVYADGPELVQALEEALADFRSRVAEALPGLEVLPAEIAAVDENWNKWLLYLEPEQLTPTFVARPTTALDAPAGERTIWLEPSPAFGEGGHASTRLAARAVERQAASYPAGCLLDVGTGTGVLAFVGLRSGLGSAVAIDNDPLALEAASANAARNGLSEHCQVSADPLGASNERFDIVVANMIAPTLLELAPQLVARVAAGGVLILSGLLVEDAASLTAAFAELGARELGRHSEGDWCSLELTPAG